jgi:cytosine/adenosine deaminase-related metal-dependent hydrolase
MQLAANTATYDRGVQLGVQPHAPYSCGLDVYRAAAKSGLPLSTHLAELIEEVEYSTHGTGAMLEFSKRLGVWDETATVVGKHPIDALAEVLHETTCVAAHLNYVTDAHIEMLADWPISVAYCPRASAYFGHAGHRYRDMLAAGVNVCLGTDSIVCLDCADRISVLDDMRFLYQRDAVDPVLLLRMATVNGAHALGIDPGLVTFAEGETAGILAIEIDNNSAIDPLQQALTSKAAPIWVSP